MVQAVVQTTVTGLQGHPVAVTAPVANQSLTWSGSAWAPGGPFLSTGGGTLTGPLVLSGNAAAALQPVSLQQLQAGYLPLAGGTLTGGLNGTTGTFSGTVAVGGSGSGLLTFPSTGGTVGYLGRVQATQAGIVYSPGFQASWNANDGSWFWGNTGIPMTLTGAGNLIISGSLTQGSDENSKTNINPLTQGISLIRQLLPKSFAWNTTPETLQWGFIAQDVQGVIPVAVSQQVGAGQGGTTILGLDTNAILAAVTMAVKQLDQRCVALETAANITPPAAELA